VAFFGLMRAGACAVHLSPLDAPRELVHKLRDSGARVLVTTNIGGLLAGALRLLDGGLIDRVIVGDNLTDEEYLTRGFGGFSVIPAPGRAATARIEVALP
jgi:hypothetical protein